MTDLCLAIVYIQNGNPRKSKQLLEAIVVDTLASRRYLYHGCWAQWHKQFGSIATEATTRKSLSENYRPRSWYKKPPLPAILGLRKAAKFACTLLSQRPISTKYTYVNSWQSGVCEYAAARICLHVAFIEAKTGNVG